jgi:peptidoglycan/xylan/chitin deacetylase (PgdA/CDA1 family)
MFYLKKTPFIFKVLYPRCYWSITNNNNSVYLTFDDGPSKSVTQKTLDILKENNILATFFLIGQKVVENRDIFQKIKDAGHSFGNHTHNHPNGWKTKNNEYFNNVEKCQKVVGAKLFRPPYGKISFSQVKQLIPKYKIIMWDVVGGDFDPSQTSENIVNNIVNNTKSGSIIVLHDSEKFGDKMLIALPKIIKQLKDKGFNFLPINS